MRTGQKLLFVDSLIIQSVKVYFYFYFIFLFFFILPMNINLLFEIVYPAIKERFRFCPEFSFNLISLTCNRWPSKNWLIDFNGMSNRFGLFYGKMSWNHFYCTFILIYFVSYFLRVFVCFCCFLFFFFLHAVIWYQVFLPNTNNFHTFVWLQVFLSNTIVIYCIHWRWTWRMQLTDTSNRR